MRSNYSAILRRAASLALVFILTLSALWLLLAAAAAIPNDAIRANMEKSALHYAEREPFSFAREGRWNTVADNYADAILLGVAWNMGIDGALNTRYNDGGELGENAGLFLAVTQGDPANTDYTRYWHGMCAPVRPLLLITDVAGIKLAGFLAILALAAVSIALLIQKKHIPLAVMLAAALAAVHIWNARLAMEYQPGFLVALTMLPFWLTLERRNNAWLMRLAVITGVCIAFFDFLTTETLSILLPLILIVYIREKEGRLGEARSALLQLIGCGGAWLAAYAGTFLAKWIAVSAATGENMFAPALSGAAERIGGAMQNGIESPRTILSPITANFTQIFTAGDRVEYAKTLLALAGMALIFVSVWYLLRADTGHRNAALLILALGMLVPLRYIVMNNHSFLHSFFTYRALASTLLAAMAALWLSIRVGGKQPKREMRQRRRK